MATRFQNAIAVDVGTTESVVFTAPLGEKSILIGCNVANKTGGILPVSLILRSDSTDSYIVKNMRVSNGENAEIMKGNKLVFGPGDQLVAISADDSAFDVIASFFIGAA